MVMKLYKTHGVFYPSTLIEKARNNINSYKWAKDIKQQIEGSAQPWMRFSDDELWDMMFSCTITRSWMVWSDGYCPNCKNDVRMYSWKMNALDMPYKVQCPHCDETFPKNDFYKFYLSGLDKHSVFNPQKADRSLLFNVDHPESYDPLNKFGVDDGEGYVEDGKRWRFIGAYLVYGQWKQAILGGIRNLASAYLITGNHVYAHKAGVFLDRVADLYPTHDFGKQGSVYEQQGRSGYVSTWHDACEETRELVLAYDMVFDGIKEDRELVKFLSKKAKQYELDNSKSTFKHIQHNIEDRILWDPLRDEDKIYSNYPRTEIAKAVINAVLDGDKNRDDAHELIENMIEKATEVDGVTGEKGLVGYSAYTVHGLALLLATYEMVENGFLKRMLKLHPQLHQTFRFFIDTWCFQKYYPLTGDTGSYARDVVHYAGVPFSKNPGLSPSMFTFLWKLYKITDDPAFVQVIYHENGYKTDGLPYDLFNQLKLFQKKVAEAIKQVGTKINTGSVNKQGWCLAILRSGEDDDARALWLDYDSGGRHGHADGMNLGLFAKGLDLLPDFGYPPVQYGGWGAPKAVWYTMSSAHNTVVVDGHNHHTASGKTTLWANGKRFKAIRASGAELINGKQFERTAIMVDISESDFYVVDIFRVIGGTDHAKFTHSHFGQIITKGLSLSQTDDYGHDTQMRNFKVDPSPKSGWSVDWKIEDRYKLLSNDAEIHFLYTDLTKDAQAYTCEKWISPSGYDENEDVWIPSLMVRRQSSEESLASTFVSVMEPYEGSSKIAGIRRLTLENPNGEIYTDANVAIEVQLVNGYRDILVAIDSENPLGLTPKSPVIQSESGLRMEGEMCFVRLSKMEKVHYMCIYGGKFISIANAEARLGDSSKFSEIITY
ncbi:MAG: hypothetical protein QG641_1381 [Candidatus Poribacteria bacterium]|nr:hypothetical protein [Candidatus Poribacteria bacterium]